jgi:hypothetical protein
MDTSSGAYEESGSLVNVDYQCGGIDFDARGMLWGISDGDFGPPNIFTINPDTGVATVVSETLIGFESFAIAPPVCGIAEVPTLSEWGLIAMAGILGIVGFMVTRRRKVTA